MFVLLCSHSFREYAPPPVTMMYLSIKVSASTPQVWTPKPGWPEDSWELTWIVERKCFLKFPGTMEAWIARVISHHREDRHIWEQSQEPGGRERHIVSKNSCEAQIQLGWRPISLQTSKVDELMSSFSSQHLKAALNWFSITWNWRHPITGICASPNICTFVLMIRKSTITQRSLYYRESIITQRQLLHRVSYYPQSITALNQLSQKRPIITWSPLLY